MVHFIFWNNTEIATSTAKHTGSFSGFVLWHTKCVSWGIGTREYGIQISFPFLLLLSLNTVKRNAKHMSVRFLMKTHSVSKCFQYIACHLEELFQMAGDAGRLMCLCGACTAGTEGFSAAFIMLVVTAVLKQHLNFSKHSVWRSALALPTSPVANQEGRWWKFLTCASQGVQGGFWQQFYCYQCCRVAYSKLKNISALLQADLRHLFLSSRASPVRQFMVWQVPVWKCLALSTWD